jgi:hypothetical protein
MDRSGRDGRPMRIVDAAGHITVGIDWLDMKQAVKELGHTQAGAH